MDNNKQRIKIAEACGYTHVRIIKAIEGPPDIGIGHHPTEPHSIPDYLNDLNAMHQAEEVLSDLQYRKYCNLLDEAGYDDRGVNYPTWSRSATASQRAEAFLKTLNLWKE